MSALVRALEPPGFLAARAAEPPLSLTERMAHGEAAPSSEADMDARRSALQAKGWQVAQAQGAQLLQVRRAPARWRLAVSRRRRRFRRRFRHRRVCCRRFRRISPAAALRRVHRPHSRIGRRRSPSCFTS
jgi:hypothetical protein